VRADGGGCCGDDDKERDGPLEVSWYVLRSALEVLLHEMQSQETRSIVAHDGSFCLFFNCIGGVKRQEQVVVPQFEARQK